MKRGQCFAGPLLYAGGSFVLCLVVGLGALAGRAGAETIQPRYPVPTHVSEAAQAVLAAPIEVSVFAPQTAEQWRALSAQMEARFAPALAARIAALPVRITRKEMGGVPVREIVPKPPLEPRAGKVLLNVHGGGYFAMGGDLSVMEGLGLAVEGPYRVVSVDYRMPPDDPFPAAVNDGVAVYRELLKSTEPGNIAIFGSSAGGGLAAAVTLAARDQGLPLPGAVVMHTPWADLSKTGDSYFTNEGVDPVLPTYDGVLEGAALIYAGDAGLNHPLVSPVYADFAPGFPPALLSTGTRDLLLSPTVRLHRKLRRAGVPAELHVFDAMWHGLSMMPEGAELQAEVLVFLDKNLGN